MDSKVIELVKQFEECIDWDKLSSDIESNEDFKNEFKDRLKTIN